MKGITVTLHDIDGDDAVVEFHFETNEAVFVTVRNRDRITTARVIQRQLEPVIRAMGYKMVKDT